MNKKIIACSSALIMTFSMIQPIYADNTTMESWETAYVEANEGDISRANNYIALTDSYYYDGSYALSVKYPDYVEGGHITLKNTLSQPLPAGKYTVKFNIRGNYYDDCMAIILGADVIMLDDSGWEKQTNLEGADGNKKWKSYELEYTTTEDISDFAYRFDGYINGCNLDCISITDESGNEYISNGSFESVSEEINSEYEKDSYSPVNLMTTSISGGLVISWKNPSTSNLKAIQLYDITDEEKLLSNELDNTAGSINTYKHTGLVNGSTYHYKLVILYTDGNKLEYYVYGVPQAEKLSVSNWSNALSTSNDDGYTTGAFALDATEKTEGNVSLKCISNSNGGGGRYMLLTQYVNVETGADYRLNFKAKAKNNEANMKIMNKWDKLDGVSSLYASGITGTYDWKDITIDIKGTTVSSIDFFFLIEGRCEGLWIDDVSLFKVEDGEKVGSNLIKNSGFEESYTPSDIGKVNGLSAEGGDEKINLSWNGILGAKKIAVFEVIDDEYHPRGYISSSAQNLTLANLQNDVQYTFALAGEDNYGLLGEYSQVIQTTVSPAFKVYQPTLYNGSKEVHTFASGVKYNVKTKVRNNSIDEDVPVTQIVALYKGNVLKKVVSVDGSAKKLAPTAPATVLNAAIEIPEGNIDDYYLCVFVWDSKAGMKSQYEYVTFEKRVI